MAGNPVDPLQLLSAALAVPADSKEQADLLATLRESLEIHPSPIPILCTTLIKTVSGAGDSLLKRWVLDLLQFAIARSALSVEARTQLASQSLDTLASLLNDPSPITIKVVVQCLTSAYPLLFRMLCTNRNARQYWDTLTMCKNRILEFVWARHVSTGVQLVAVKFMQRIILVQTRGVTDPRLQNKNDPNISFCPSDHPFMSAKALEAEGIKLLENVIDLLYKCQHPDIVTAILNSWGAFVKLRPAFVQLVVSTLIAWTPDALASFPASSIKSVEKAVRILLVHILRGPHAAPFSAQINMALMKQATRMDAAAAAEKERKAAMAAAAVEETRKRSASATIDQPSDAKRPRLEQSTVASTSASFLSAFDFTALPSALITELIVANLQAFTEPALRELIQAYRQSNIIRTAEPPAAPSAAPQPVPSLSEAGPSTAPAAEPQAVKEEPLDPLSMDIDEEEMEYEPDKINYELSGVAIDRESDPTAAEEILSPDFQHIEFKLPPPKEQTEGDRNSLIRGSMNRIWKGMADLSVQDPEADRAGPAGASDVWMLLIVRMITRVVEPSREHESEDQPPADGEEMAFQDNSAWYERQDRQRQILCDYIMSNFSSRVRLASTWMNEEWYNDRIRSERDSNWHSNYETWLNQIVSAYETHLDGKDRMFSRFLLDLPSIPADVLNLLRDLCVDPERMQVGFTTLREFVVQRPSLRSEALNILLELTTHPEKITRGAAIITVKRWVPDAQPMDEMIREFAVQLLRKLQPRPSKPAPDEHVNGNGGGGGDEYMEDGQLPGEDEVIQTAYLPDRIELPAKKAHVLQHVELLFALSVKVPEFLDEIFSAYGQMDVTVQAVIQDLITPLIKSLGSSHGKLLTLLRSFPPGSDTLALRVLTIFTEHGRPSAQLVALVKGLLSERDLDARFLIPIIAEMDKADIMRYLPRIVSILNGQSEPKALVRSVFSSVVTTPPQTFGSVSSNLPRVRHSELLTPAELMVLLHESEKEIGLKSAIEAIGICFSMTDVYRSEILAVVMQQIVDEPVLPVLFLRTVIQAVTTYKSLVGFVSTTLLSRLITKKIWTNPPLWEGFIRCAKAIAPASFGALLQLPKDQLRELVDKQPGLKAGLRDYVMKKAGNKARVAGFLDIFGEDRPSSPPPSATPTEVPVAAPSA